MSYKRKYRKGAVITSLDELAEQEFIYVVRGVSQKILHAGWFLSWQFRLVKDYLRSGMIYRAERIEQCDT